MISVICSTNRKESNSAIFAHAISGYLTEMGQANTVLDLFSLPDDFVFNNEVYGIQNERLLQIQDKHITQADKYIFVIPEYNGSFPGVVKAFIDSFSPSRIHNKKALLIGISSGRAGNIRGLEHFTGVLNYLRVTVSPFKPAVPHCHNLVDLKKKSMNNKDTESLLKGACESFIKF